MPGKKILFCPLDWGLGHASRDVEIIHHLLQKGHQVVIGADKAPLLFLKEHFPELEHVIIPSYTIKYPRRGSMALKMLFSIPKILTGIVKEHRLLKQIIKNHDIDMVISDNRYGLWNKKIVSIFITHQLWIKSSGSFKFFEPFINRINHWFIKKYDKCWVPDFEGGENLSGKLSHPKKKLKNIAYIGLLSRFNIPLIKEPNSLLNEQFDILAIISGPEPQRSILEELLVKQIAATKYKTLIVQGLPGKKTQKNVENISFVNHLKSFVLKQLIIKTQIIICRSGYSSIMDLVKLQKSALLIPTPGQTEQEYFASYLGKKKWFYTVTQKEFELEKAISELAKTKINCKFRESKQLKNAIP